ncbi:hypothetical protein RA28_10435 [Ruegeria sp. ANG-S4]|nr:hypothetical protein RA28_10435 [Ruegeria sp. ANG-S4]
MKYQLVLRIILFGIVCGVLHLQNRADAQVVELGPGGTQMTLGIAQRFESGRNLRLEVPEEGHGTISSTILSFGVSSETPIQSLSLDAVTALRWTDLPNEDSDFDIGDSIFEFGYAREGANAGLDFGVDFSSYDIGLFRSLNDFIDDEGVLDLPSDFGDLTGDGTRREFNSVFQMDFGRQDLISYNFRINAQNLDYVDQTSPDLFNSDTIGGSAGIGFVLSPVTTATIDIRAERYEEDNPDQTDRKSKSVVFGLSQEVSARTRFDVALGYTEIDERELIAGDDFTSGFIGRIGAEYDMPNGEITFDAESELSLAGRLNSFRIGRSREILGATFSVSLGFAHTDGGRTEPIGSLRYANEFGENELRIFFDRNIVITDDEVFRDEYILDFGYIWGLGPSSRLGLGATHILTDSTEVDPRVERTDLNAVYSYELESQWIINAGLNYSVRDEDGVGRATSPLAFFQIGREFAWRP